MAKLTLAEQKLLNFPPTTATWRCKAYRLADGMKVHCGQLNVGMSRRCWICAKPKPSRPELVWPEYVRVCKKAGIEPTGRLSPPVEPNDVAPRKRTRRKGN